MTTDLGPAAYTTRLRAALDALGDALAAPAVESLTAAEASLAAVLAEFSQLSLNTIPDGARAGLLAEVSAARRALARARRLGEALSSVVHATLEAQGRFTGYDRRGDEPVHAPAGAFGARG